MGGKQSNDKCLMELLEVTHKRLKITLEAFLQKSLTIVALKRIVDKNVF